MRPGKRERPRAGDRFRARLDQIIDMRHELVELVNQIDWDWLISERVDRFSDLGRADTGVRFMLGLFVLKHIYALSVEEVCARRVENPYFRYFTGEDLFHHRFPHARSCLSHWRRRIGDKLDIHILLAREPPGRV